MPRLSWVYSPKNNLFLAEIIRKGQFTEVAIVGWRGDDEPIISVVRMSRVDPPGRRRLDEWFGSVKEDA